MVGGMEIAAHEIEPARWRTGLSRVALADAPVIVATPVAIEASDLEIHIIASFML